MYEQPLPRAITCSSSRPAWFDRALVLFLVTGLATVRGATEGEHQPFREIRQSRIDPITRWSRWLKRVVCSVPPVPILVRGGSGGLVKLCEVHARCAKDH